MNRIEILDWQDSALDIYTRYNETQLYHYHEPHPGIFIAESALIVERALNANYQPISFLIEKSYLEQMLPLIEPWDVPVYVAEKEVLDKIKGFSMTRGVLCAMQRKALVDLKEIVANASRIAVLENVMNPTNIGAIFRSAAALNIEAIVLTSSCSDPLYRRAVRVSMGTVFQIPWTYFESEESGYLKADLASLKALGFKTVSMALTDQSVSIDYPALKKEEKLAIILGTEGEGLNQATIEDSDYTVKIPMAHGVDSLNVAAASAVAFWELTKKG